MEPDRAIEIVQKLADGVDPYSGELFPSTSPYQQADTVRVLNLAVEAIESKKKHEDRRKERSTNTGSPWTNEEDDWITQGHDDGATIREMAASHGRTAGREIGVMSQQSMHGGVSNHELHR